MGDPPPPPPPLPPKPKGLVDLLQEGADTVMGGGAAEGRASLLVLAAFVVGAGGIGAALSAARMRATHAELAQEALDRARAIEDRLFRVGIAMEWRSAGATLYQDALARLERDVATPREEPARAD